MLAVSDRGRLQVIWGVRVLCQCTGAICRGRRVTLICSVPTSMCGSKAFSVRPRMFVSSGTTYRYVYIQVVVALRGCIVGLWWVA